MSLVYLALLVGPFCEILESGGVCTDNDGAGKCSVFSKDSDLSLIDSDYSYKFAGQIVAVDSLVVFVARSVEAYYCSDLCSLTVLFGAVSEGYDKVSGFRLIRAEVCVVKRQNDIVLPDLCYQTPVVFRCSPSELEALAASLISYDKVV